MEQAGLGARLARDLQYFYKLLLGTYSTYISYIR